MGSQRVRHDWVTELRTESLLNSKEDIPYHLHFLKKCLLNSVLHLYFSGSNGESGAAVSQEFRFLYHQPVHTGPPCLYILSGWGHRRQKHSSWKARSTGYCLRYVGPVSFCFFFFFFATLHGMQNFPDQGSNPLGCQGSPFYFLSWHMACRILVPWPGIEPRSTTVKALGPNHWTPREVPVFLKLWKDVKNFPILHSPTYVQF